MFKKIMLMACLGVFLTACGEKEPSPADVLAQQQLDGMEKAKIRTAIDLCVREEKANDFENYDPSTAYKKCVAKHEKK